MKLTQPYLQYPESMIERINLFKSEKPSIFLYVNMDIIHKLNLDEVLTQDGCEALSGYDSSWELTPLALAYAGHQFGYFARLGDGRACVLGRFKGFDVSLKGSGPTRFARGGDGLAPLPSLIKETLYSHALSHLKIPASKVLSITYAHKHAHRDMVLPAGILSRLMRTNIRIGSIEYAKTFLKDDGVKDVITLAMNQLTPSLNQDEDGIKKFIETCVTQWGQLVAMWQAIGFVHGVLNSDNVSLAYETIDFGPCAFLETVNQDKAFSSIDVSHRYAYARQKEVMKFNTSLFLNACESLIVSDNESVNSIKNYYLTLFDQAYENTLSFITSRKLGLVNPNLSLWQAWIDLCETHQLDFTQALVSLTYDESSLFNISESMDMWLKKRQELIELEGLTSEKRLEIMSQTNPVIVLRHDLVNTIIESCLAQDFSMFDEVMNMLKTPYDKILLNHPWFKPSTSKIVTTCGT
jgi:serine/tyrosine/threonine adenylyltransferase